MIPRNREQVIFNPYQGDTKKVLCVCSAGVLRSPTAAVVLQREYGYNTRAAGVSPDYALIVVEEGLILWADEIVCMQQAHANHMLNSGVIGNHMDKVQVLSILDNYSYMDEELQKLILKKYKVTDHE